ncbi:MAG: prolyl oligopeptidase family serine peptidase [Armatimonadota bacterium]
MPRSVTIDDLFHLKLVSDAQISPDGEQVMCVVKRIDREKNKYFSHLYLCDLRTREVRQFTNGEVSDSQPRWSPDGRWIAFVSNRQKPQSQIFLIPADGGEAQALTSLEEGSIGEIAWSPDGSKIAFTFRLTPEDWRDSAVKERKEKGLSTPPRVITRPFYRLDGSGYFDGEYFQVWVADAHTGEAKRLTNEDTSCGSLCWSPDGQYIAFVCNRSENPDLNPNLEDIWLIPAEGGEIQRVQTPKGPKSGIAFSPDGTRIAYIGHTKVEDIWGITNDHLWVADLAKGEARDIMEDFDRSLGNLTLSDMRDVGGQSRPVWTPDGRRLLFLASNRGSTMLYSISAEGGEPVPLRGERADITSFTLSADGRRVAWCEGTPVQPHEVFAGTMEGDSLAEAEAVMHFNAEWLTEVQLQEPEEFTCSSPDGNEVHGWILHPLDFDPAKRYPLILEIHGGPHAQYGWAFFHEFQLLAAQGYVVVYANPRGSKGYGEAYTAAIKGAWGGPDYADLMAVVDFVLHRGTIDETRMGVMGGSYGGYMTNWVVSHTDRFRAAITDRSVVNLHSMAGTCDYPLLPGDYFRGNAWAEPEHLWEHSPLKYAGDIRTPLLIIHSEGDLRCPIEQAEQLFAALKVQGKEAVLVRYPQESSHGMSRSGPPDLRVHRLEQILQWWAKYLMPNTEEWG